MTRIAQRMRTEAMVLQVLERRRREEKNPDLGRCVERALIDRCLEDLEWDLFVDPPAMPEPEDLPPR